MIHCLIIDDEQVAIDLLKIYMEDSPALKLVASFTNPLEGLKFAKENAAKIDVVFLDIHMEKLPGTALIGMLPSHIKTVFTTGFTQYGAEAFDLGAVDYLVKPYSFEKFSKTVGKLQALMANNAVSDTCFVSVDKKLFKITTDEVVHVEGQRNFLKFYLQNGTEILATSTFQEVEKYLKEPHFIRINKSHIVAFARISAVEGNQVRIQDPKRKAPNGVLLPIGITYRKHFFGMINRV